MVIEVYHKGKVILSEEVKLPEQDFTLPFKKRYEEREEMVRLAVEDFKANRLPKLYRNLDVYIAVVFESKMNSVKPELKPIYQDVQRRPDYVPKSKAKQIEEEPKPIVRPKAVYSNPGYLSDYV